MPSKNYEQKSRIIPYVRKFDLNNNRKTPNLCPDCKDTENQVKLISDKVNRIKEIVDNFYNRLPKKKSEQLSIFNARFTLNNVPCELEYDLKNFTLEELQKLANFTTQNFNSNTNFSSTSSKTA